MDPQTCRAKIARLIQEETTALGELAVLLEREFTHLKDSDVEALGGAMRERQQCVLRILKVDDERRELCRALGRPFDLKGLEALIAWCDPQGTLVSAWAGLSEPAWW